jgi:euchromatic histone-lysine N-methyltransferase
MDSQKPNSNLAFPSAPPGFRTPTLDLNQEPCDETPQTNLNHQEQMLTNNKTTNNMYSDLHHNAELFQSNSGSQQVQKEVIIMIPDVLKNDNTTNNAPAGEVTVPRLQPHFKELVRVSDLVLPDQQQLRAIVREIRLLYNSVRLLAVAEEEKQIVVHAERTDQRAYAVMRRHGLCLNQDKKNLLAQFPVFISGILLCIERN